MKMRELVVLCCALAALATERIVSISMREGDRVQSGAPLRPS